MLVGKDISSCSYPKSIKMTNKDSKTTLIINVKRGNEINLEYSKKEIIDKINSYFGYKLINEIRLQSMNSEERKIKNKNYMKKFSKDLEKKIDSITNKDIKKSLSQLFSAMKND